MQEDSILLKVQKRAAAAFEFIYKVGINFYTSR